MEDELNLVELEQGGVGASFLEEVGASLEHETEGFQVGCCWKVVACLVLEEELHGHLPVVVVEVLLANQEDPFP